MRTLVVFLILELAVVAFWGCPTRKYIPDPMPPQPQVLLYDAEDLPGYLGREPYIGPRVQFYRMIAEEPDLDGNHRYFTVPL